MPEGADMRIGERLRTVRKRRGISQRELATYVGVPPQQRTSGDLAHRLIPVTADRYLTDPRKLHAALMGAAGSERLGAVAASR